MKPINQQYREEEIKQFSDEDLEGAFEEDLP